MAWFEERKIDKLLWKLTDIKSLLMDYVKNVT